MPSIIVFDLEFTTWPGAPERDWSAPGELREIVQIGALRLDADFAVTDEFEILVRPVVNPRLSPYFSELTGIDQETLDREGRDPAAALGDFLGFCAGRSVLSYGNDMIVLGENVGWARARGEQVAHGFLANGFHNVRPWLNTLAPQTASVNSGRLWQALGLSSPAAGAEHSALFDCHSIAAALRHLRAGGAALPAGWL
ncbi:exonuclease domain-containing protein [Streptomyces sp. NPDC004134]|uniref:exonuclease domain-containing protein n=1 Tax=Streptomyces sp. NPDC004134 TaxID=3364691 RepID=UPI00369464DE